MPAHFLDILDDRYDALLVANGAPLTRALFARLRKRADLLIALDGGVNTLKAYRAVPDYVTGDFDSASPEALAWAKRNGARVSRLPSQEAPDLDKGLEFCRGLGLKKVIIAGFSGGRTDHVLASLAFVVRIRGIEATLITDDVVAFPLRGRVEREFRIPARHTISWFAFPKAGLCTLSGVRWPFQNRTLSSDGFHSLSNQAINRVVQLRQKAGRSILFVSLLPQARNPVTRSEWSAHQTPREHA